MKLSRSTKAFPQHLLLLLAALAMFFPLIWMLLLSLSDNPPGDSTLSELIHGKFTLANYADGLDNDQFARYFFNSVFVSTCIAVASSFFSVLVAYAFARRHFPFKRTAFAIVLGVLMVPPHVMMISLYREIVSFGWMNTYAALTVPFLVTPFGIFLMRQYILELPYELEEAATLDGASTWHILRTIVFPLAKPMLIVLFIYQFLTAWNSFIFPFLFVNTSSMRTLPVGLAFFLGKQSVDWGHLMAGAGMSAIPVLVLFAVFQRKIIAGLTAGAVKG
jgi:ABC-type glycerol-3-phosphate transport system permease component